MGLQSPIQFDGQVRWFHGVCSEFKPGTWIFSLNNKKKWILQVTRVVGVKKPETAAYQLDTALSFPCTSPHGLIYSMSFSCGGIVDYKSTAEDIKRLYETAREILKSSGELHNLSVNVNSRLPNGIENNAAVPVANARKKMDVHAAHNKLLESSQEKKPELALESDSAEISYTNVRAPYVSTRPRREQNCATPVKRGALDFLDKENEKRTPTTSASTPTFNNRTPLSDKHSGLMTAQFYGPNLPIPKIPGVNNLPSNSSRLRTAKRIKPPLHVVNSADLSNSKRPKNVVHENDIFGKPMNSALLAKQPLLGFSNLGNTCYMNSILQSLFALDVFTRELWKTYTQLKDHVTEDSLLYSLPQLLKNKDGQRAIKDDLLSRIKHAISVSATRFSGCSQHDAHEFLAQVLDQLKEEMKKLCDDNKKKLSNAVENNFEFGVSHSIQCQNDEDQPISLQKLIDTFFNSEEVTYKCAKCTNELSIIQRNFVKLPRILILHVKRYNFDSKISKNFKSTHTILIPKYLMLSQHCDEKFTPYSEVSNSTKKIVFFDEKSPPRCVRRTSIQSPASDMPRQLRSLSTSPVAMTHGPSSVTPPSRSSAIVLASVSNGSTPSTSGSKARRQLYVSSTDGSTIERPPLNQIFRRYNFRRLGKQPCYVERSNHSSPNFAESSPVPNSSQIIDEEAEYQEVLQRSLIEQRTEPMDDEDFQRQMDEAKELSLLNQQNQDSTLDGLALNSSELLAALETEATEVDKKVEAGCFQDAFRLCGIVAHLGLSSSTGHYVCDVFDVRQQKWRSFDDSRVTDAVEEDVRKLRRRDGYIFFYVAKKILDEFDYGHTNDSSASVELSDVSSCK